MVNSDWCAHAASTYDNSSSGRSLMERATGSGSGGGHSKPQQAAGRQRFGEPRSRGTVPLTSFSLPMYALALSLTMVSSLRRASACRRDRQGRWSREAVAHFSREWLLRGARIPYIALSHCQFIAVLWNTSPDPNPNPKKAQ